ncbi:MAG: DegV family protein [Actinomycetota bacterium]|nr:DegV family protein [Actinomycetota bacterium]
MSRTSRVAVVTDSTAYLPDGLASRYGVVVVPVQVVIDGRVGSEGVDVSPAEVAAALGQRHPAVSTSRPAPQAFLDAYDAAAETGAGTIVSVHLSGALSGTVDSARLAARERPEHDIRVLDSGSLTMGLGFAVLAAAELASAGAEARDVERAAVTAAARTCTMFYVDNLEHLRRGGRLNTAQAMLGSALMVKPLLRVSDGRISLLEKVRTASRGLARLADLAVQEAGDDAVDIAVHHLAAGTRAAELAEQLRTRIPRVTTMYLSEVGAVVGAHVGPGLVGVVVHRR